MPLKNLVNIMAVEPNVPFVINHDDIFTKEVNISLAKLVDFLIGHYTYRIFPPAIDIIPTLLAVVYSNGKYTN